MASVPKTHPVELSYLQIRVRTLSLEEKYIYIFREKKKRGSWVIWGS